MSYKLITDPKLIGQVEDLIINERMGQRKVAKTLKVSRDTIQKIVKKNQKIQEYYRADSIPVYAPTDEMKEEVKVIEVDKNTQEVEAYLKNRIVTLEDLIKTCKIDTEVWAVERWVANKWENVAKNSLGDGVIITPMFQVKAWLKRKNPIPINFPPIQSVTFNIKPGDYTQIRNDKGLKTALCIPDAQIGFRYTDDGIALDPFHDRRCWDILLQVMSKFSFDTIVLLGDMLDLTDWSDKFVVTPDMYRTTQSSLIEFGWYLAKIRELQPKAKIVYIEGNHEARLPRKIANNIQAGYNLCPIDQLDKPALSIRGLLALDKFDIEYIGDYPDGEYWLNDNLRLEHGSYSSGNSGATTQKIIKDVRSSVIMAHCHKVELASKTTFPRNRSVTYSVYSLGTISRIDGRVPGRKKKTNWQQGFGIVDYEEGNGQFHVDVISINNGKTIIDGTMYQGKSLIRDIYRDTKWKFFAHDKS